MINALPGLVLVMTSLGLSKSILDHQKQQFKKLTYRTDIEECDIIGMLDNPQHTSDTEKKCFMPDLASHKGNNPNTALRLLELAVSQCLGESCDEP